jgi:hypothetical protein
MRFFLDGEATGRHYLCVETVLMAGKRASKATEEG